MERQTRHVYLNGSNVEIGRFRRRSQRRFVVHRIHNVTINRERWFQQQQQQGQEAQNWANANDRRCSFKTWPSCSISVVWKHDTQHTATRQQEAMSIVEMQKGPGETKYDAALLDATGPTGELMARLSFIAIRYKEVHTTDGRGSSCAQRRVSEQTSPTRCRLFRTSICCLFFFFCWHTHTHTLRL